MLSPLLKNFQRPIEFASKTSGKPHLPSAGYTHARTISKQHLV
jgi:hypothetical protein